MNWVIKKETNETNKYKWLIGYWINQEKFVTIFRYETLKSAIRMLNYLNGGSGQYEQYLLEDNH